MILTTAQQAHNFVLYVLDYNAYCEDLMEDALVGFLMTEVCSVFGKHTFSDDELNDIIMTAIRVFDNR